MVRVPNEEQLDAIKHNGGVLLKAGAGSGKTFVLVEHIFYLTSCWIDEFKFKKNLDFESFIRAKYSCVVMMTFTKKASGEMNTRIVERFRIQSEFEGPDKLFWKIANDMLSVLTVTTIHGFCFQLIRNGIFTDFFHDAKIISETEKSSKVKKLFDDWFTFSLSNFDQSQINLIIREKKYLLSAFNRIFNDPEIRISWRELDFEKIQPSSMDKILSNSFDLNGLSRSIDNFKSLNLDDENNHSAFEKIVYIFQKSGPDIVDSLEKFKIYADLFESIKRLDGERTHKKKTPESVAAKDALFSLRSWIDEWKDSVLEYDQFFKSHVLPWMICCRDIFQYIDTRLDPNKGMTFGDLEYVVYHALENLENRKKVQERYQYFIIDEFQDTSAIQFQIIKYLIGNDYRKLFCVGDPKQAIYRFRGGELSVFQDCMHLVPVVKSLVSNYRSLPEVTRFNNYFFRTILPLGYNFKSTDPYFVLPEDQKSPFSCIDDDRGKVEMISLNLEETLSSDVRLTSEDVNRIEAFILADAIQKERETTSNVCTVLYSRLKPSSFLINYLMQKNIGFTAQYKIDLLDDPVLGIFILLLKRIFDKNPGTKNSFPAFMLNNYFCILGVNQEVSEVFFEIFDQDVRYWGLVIAFRKLIFKLNITNENSDLNLEFIELLSKLHHQDPESILTQFTSGLNEKINLELRLGDHSHMVQIMSAHSSKGLEFDSVYVAGIYTNGKDLVDFGTFGAFPGSFQWHMVTSLRKPRKSPMYQWENEVNRFKNFSESKRLFYVACTRAKKKLSWALINFQEKSFSVPKNSWIMALKHLLTNSDQMEFLKNIKINGLNVDDIISTKHSSSLPLFFHDPSGILCKGSSPEELIISAEMSATKFNSLIDCPRKFYFSNTLKMPEPGRFQNLSSFYEDSDDDSRPSHSGPKRGSYIHSVISKAINANFASVEGLVEVSALMAVDWTLNLLKSKIADYYLISEKPLKFKLFNFMISGTPDLILFPKNKVTTQIWDFKTGQFNPEKIKYFWTQLSIYAYALFELGRVQKGSDIEMVLCFVDQQKCIFKNINYDQCVEVLYPLWKSQNEPWKINPDHCSQCSYGIICPR
jgi:ATP-dependent exoDNAse (exonuclease V) beta subunit